ncbi:MAG: OsmC family peroxiredoxin, partial [Desulfovibrio sp.]
LSATLDVGANEKGQSRVQKITIDANVGIDEEDLDLFERVARIMKNGCLVTGSLHDGIEMAYNLNPVYDED